MYVCSCGETAPHVIARRTTEDGTVICFWSDGTPTFALGKFIPKCGVAREEWAQSANREASRALMEHIPMLSTSEVGPAYLRLRKEVRCRYFGGGTIPADIARRIIFQDEGPLIGPEKS